MADKASGGVAGGELPQAESLIPRGRQSVSAVRGDDLKNSHDPSAKTLSLPSLSPAISLQRKR